LAWEQVLLFRRANPANEAGPSTVVDEDFNTELDDFWRTKKKYGLFFLVLFSFQFFSSFIYFLKFLYSFIAIYLLSLVWFVAFSYFVFVFFNKFVVIYLFGYFMF